MATRIYTQEQIVQNRERARGTLVALLIFLLFISFMWYFYSPMRGVELVVADNAEASEVDTKQPFYVLLIGSDTRRGTALYTGAEGEEGQTTESADILTLVRIDPQERIVTLLTIPRDTLAVEEDVKISSYLEANNPTHLVEEVEKLTNVDIPFYFLITFTGFESVLTAIDGIEVDVTTGVSMQDPGTGTIVNVSSGKNQHLDGQQALAVASAWNNTGKREVVRQLQVRAIERAIIQKVATADEQTIRRLVAVLNNSTTTNMEDSLLISIVLNYAMNRADYTLYSGSGPYIGTERADGTWVVSRDSSTWSRIMHVVNRGEDPNTVVRLAPQN